ncbi:MAG: hypothetical protein ACD_79C01352G0001, partial [uncultured bacterium]
MLFDASSAFIFKSSHFFITSITDFISCALVSITSFVCAFVLASTILLTILVTAPIVFSLYKLSTALFNVSSFLSR